MPATPNKERALPFIVESVQYTLKDRNRGGSGAVRWCLKCLCNYGYISVKLTNAALIPYVSLKASQ